MQGLSVGGLDATVRRDPKENIQDAKGMAKPYQVRQVIRAIEKLESMK